MAYRFALFDADNTLLDFTRSEEEALSDCLRARGLPTDAVTLATYSAINDRHWKLLEQGKITRAALGVSRFAELFSVLDYDGDPALMAKDYLSTLATKSYLLEGALELCRRLYGRIPLYLITNGNASVQAGRFDPCPLAPLFEDVFISELIGHDKPEVAYFDAVAAAIPDFDPAAALVIGDSLSSDIRGGINAGMDTCWFNPRGKAAPADLSITYTVSTLAEIEAILLN